MTLVTHIRMRRHIGAYLDGELGGARARAVAEHLDECWDCNNAAHDLRLIRASLARTGRRSPPNLAVARLRRMASRLAG
jgi:anti-sigma factor RsiW